MESVNSRMLGSIHVRAAWLAICAQLLAVSIIEAGIREDKWRTVFVVTALVSVWCIYRVYYYIYYICQICCSALCVASYVSIQTTTPKEALVLLRRMRADPKACEQLQDAWLKELCRLAVEQGVQDDKETSD